jgi:hypothetical protein
MRGQRILPYIFLKKKIRCEVRKGAQDGREGKIKIGGEVRERGRNKWGEGRKKRR